MKKSTNAQRNGKESQIHPASGVASNTNKSWPHIFKLNVDCFEHLFEWFTLQQLLVLRRTCKRIQKVVDHYIRLTYPQLLCLRVNERRLLELCDARLNCYEWIRHLYLWSGLNGAQIDGIKYILNQLETLKLNYVQINGDFYDVLLKHCPRLKYLSVGTCTLPKTIIGTGNDWLLRHYPMLEHFEIDVRSPCKDTLEFAESFFAFFERNPNVRIFSTDSVFLSLCNQSLLQSYIRFERLDILIKHNLNTICNLTNDLYAQNIFEKLHLYGGSRAFLGEEAHNLSTFCNLEKVYVDSLPDNYPIPVMENVKELCLSIYSSLPSNVPHLMVTNLPNLKRLTMSFANILDTMLFIRYARKLEEIRIGNLDIENPEEPKFSDFVFLNEERKKLEHARKLSIFINEQYFLKFKCIETVNLTMITLKRTESFVASRSFGGT